MADFPEKISPLADLAAPRIAEGYVGVTLSERLCESLVQVQAWPGAVEKVQQIVSTLPGDVTVMATGPGRWLVEDDEEGLEEKLRQKCKIQAGAVTGLTHARVVITVEGEQAQWVLASGIALDFCEDAFPVGTTQVSHHHEIGLTIHRTGTHSFDLYVFTSLVRSFWQWLEKASAEVSYSVI